MKTRHLSFLFTILFSMVATSALSYDLAAQNADGVTIYYNYINDGTELMVTYRNSSYNSYSGTVNIPEEVNSLRVTIIGDEAFRKCTGLTSVTIPNSVTVIGGEAFSLCSGLTTITIPNSVTTICSGAFYRCSGLTSITIPNSVTVIGGNAFGNCSGLTSINIPNSIIRIESGTFRGCSSLTTVTIPNSVSYIGAEAFSDCSGLTLLNIPNSITTICGRAFVNCTSLSSITIPKSVTSIDTDAFLNCTGLSAFTIPDLSSWCMTSLGNATSNPSYYTHHIYLLGEEITDLVIPDNVTEIGGFTFCGCTGLTSVKIPNSVTEIGSYAFQGCSGLTIITSLNSTPPSCSGNDPFFNVDHTIPVYVPQGSVLNYKAANWWRNFVVFREIGSEGDDVLLTIKDGGNGKTQLLVDESKPYFTLFFKADSGWKLHSVTLNGDNVTPEVGSDGKYTTPVLTSSSTINVVYLQTSQSISAIPNTSVQVKARNGEIVISSDNSSAIPVIIYNIDGKVVGRETIIGGETHIALPTENIYVIKVDGQTFKVSL